MGAPMTMKEKPLGEGDHWRKFYDSQVLRWWHMPPKDVTLTIERITELDGKVGKQSKRQLMARFKGAKLPFALNATNGTTLEQLYGADPHGWFGQRVTLYVTTTEMNGRTVNCIRIRPAAPRGAAAAPEAEAAALDFDASNPEDDGREGEPAQ